MAAIASSGFTVAAMADTGDIVPDLPLTSALADPGVAAGEATGCDLLPLNGDLTKSSTSLKQAFCEMLTFAPRSLTSIETFYGSIRPEPYASDEAPSAEGMTLPSLWWSRDSLPRQFGSYRLVDSWTAYEIRTSAMRVVDVYINPQIWRLLEYSERYGALNHLATEALNYQYQVRFFTSNLRDPRLLGLYVCDFPAADEFSSATVGADRLQPGCMAIVNAETLARMQSALLDLDDPVQPSTEPVVGADPAD